MEDPRASVFKAEPPRLAAMLEVEPTRGRAWHPDELAAILKHQLAAPVLEDVEGQPSGQLLSKEREGASHPPTGSPAAAHALAESERRGSRQEGITFDDLFHRPDPPVGLLRSVKEFAKANRNRPSSVLPNEIATLLYFGSIVVALKRCGQRITSLTDRDIRAGLDWVLGQGWVDERTKSVFRRAAAGRVFGKGAG
jgi:hypothetical protein